jgi:hypothetical protein
MTYVRWPSRRGSWHVFVTVTRANSWLLRCGRSFPEQIGIETAESLPLDERSCERCLQLASRDEQPDVSSPGDGEVPS